MGTNPMTCIHSPVKALTPVDACPGISSTEAQSVAATVNAISPGLHASLT